jgi:trehalose transport system permease protein
MSLNLSARKVLFAILVIIVSIYAISPVYFMVTMSLGNPQETFASQHPAFFISEIYYADETDRDATGTNWDNILPKWWLRVLLEKTRDGVEVDQDLSGGMAKSLRVATITALASLVIAIPGAYAISRLAPRLKYGLIPLLFVTRMYPDVGIALQVAITFLQLDKIPGINLYDTVFGLELVLAHMILTLPLAAWVLVSTFETIPRDLEQAASIDGASRIKTLLRIVIPIAAPGIAVAAIFAWLASWEEVTYAIYLTLFNRTLPIEVVNGVWRSPPPVIATQAAIITIPTIIITYFMQRWIKAEQLAGAVKG